MKHTKYSAIVAGIAAAGLYAAIKLQKEADLPDSGYKARDIFILLLHLLIIILSE